MYSFTYILILKVTLGKNRTNRVKQTKIADFLVQFKVLKKKLVIFLITVKSSFVKKILNLFSCIKQLESIYTLLLQNLN